MKHFLDLFEAAHLVYKLAPHGYGKEVLRGRYKYYLADAAIAGSVLFRGTSLLEAPDKLGAAVETAFFKHVFTRFYPTSIGFSYWKGKKGHEVDIVAEVGGEIVPFEVKYESNRIGPSHVKGLVEFCKEKQVERGYLICREPLEFEPLTAHGASAQILKIPAPLACFWLSESERP
ncbi:MAG: DUF4143 domain-containing protein [Planctomycetia bacterium]|nr:DUF4143 domain-containing protein [Planctomycetia bacterium]